MADRGIGHRSDANSVAQVHTRVVHASLGSCNTRECTCPADGGSAAGWAAALGEIEHQAAHWDTPDHGDVGKLLAAVLRSAVEIARAGGLMCDEHPTERLRCLPRPHHTP
jgi:hypothetical protein